MFQEQLSKGSIHLFDIEHSWHHFNQWVWLQHLISMLPLVSPNTLKPVIQAQAKVKVQCNHVLPVP